MTIYMTKVWGWEIPVGPLQFSTLGWRERAREMLQDGDHVVLVGTQGEQTPDQMKGSLLGVMEPTIERVASLDFDIQRSPDDFTDGKYKWPFALLNHRAWLLSDRPFLNEISDRKFNMDSAQGIVALTDEEAARVRTLVWKEVELLQATAQAKARLERKRGRRAGIAPPPSTTRTGVMHMRRAPAYTYAMKVEGTQRSTFKIGWAFDFERRAAQFNHASLPELGGLSYKPFFYHLWDTARQAYAMEQRLLRTFEDSRHNKNNEIIVGISEQRLEATWSRCLTEKYINPAA